MRHEQLKLYIQCTCGSAFAVSESYEFWPTSIQHLFDDWQRDHKQCRTNAQLLQALQIRQSKRLAEGK